MIGAFRRRRNADALEVNGRGIRLDPSRLLGSGGEAEVYDLGGHIALKLFKRADHADYAHDRDAQNAAEKRLAVHQTKLPALLKLQLPPRVVAPLALALDSGGGVAGYTMPLVANAEPLLRFTDRTFRRNVSDDAVVRILAGLHETVEALHRAGVVIGDFNDLNVLVTGFEARLIDVDSAQFGPFPCTLFTTRFLDPRLTDGRTLQPVRPQDAESDWYAFAVMAFHLLLFVDPYGGVYHPPHAAARLPHDHRPLRRISVFHRDVRYPKQATPIASLPVELADYFRRVFEQDGRGVFPLHLLRPATAPAAARRSALTVRGRVSAEEVEDFPPVPEPRRHWLDGGVLLRDGSLGPEVVGDVLARQTRIWTGPSFGFGFYRASEMTVGFVYDALRRGIRDDVRLPRITGHVVDADAVFAGDRCWFFLATQQQGRLLHRCTLIGRDGTVEATLEAEPVEGHWLSHIHGHAAAAGFLLAGTDEGIVRIEPANGTLAVTATFPDTADFVTAGTRLLATPHGVYAGDGTRVLRLRIG